MQLLILLLAAAIFGYWLANSRYRKTIDQATEKAVETTRSWTDGASDWLQSSILRKQDKTDAVEESITSPEPSNEEQPAEEEQEARPAKKRASRRKNDEE